MTHAGAVSYPLPMLEIERKYLVKHLPIDLGSFPHLEIKQGYLAYGADGTSVRIRTKGKTCFLTIKGPGDLVRTEIEVVLSSEQFDTLWPGTQGARLEKTRYYLPLHAHTIELDVYHGRLQGLLIAEVEFTSQKEALGFIAPDWFGEDVSADPRYKNHVLARNGLPG